MKRMPLWQACTTAFFIGISQRGQARARRSGSWPRRLRSAPQCSRPRSGSRASRCPARHPGLNAILAKANALSEQIDQLSQQYDGLKIQLAQARVRGGDRQAGRASGT